MKRYLLYMILSILPIAFVDARTSGQIKIDRNDVQLSKQGGYDVISLDGNRFATMHIGAPELPVIVKKFVIPADAEVTGLDVTVSGRAALDGTFMPIPVRPPVTVGSTVTDFVEPADSVYDGAKSYPAVRAEIVGDNNQMGYHVVTLCFYPFEFEPQTKKVYLNDISFNIRYRSGAVDVKRPKAQSEYRAKLTRKMIAAVVDNPEDIEVFYNDGQQNAITAKASNELTIPTLEVKLSEQVPDYIIITNKELRSEFQTLADWKIQKGVPTIIKDIDEIGNEYLGADLPEKIHAYLQECRDKWGEGLFVLLGGDTEIIPTRLYKEPDNLFYPSDLYYSDLNYDWNTNKNNLYAERKNYDSVKMERCCFIGRAPVANKSQASVFVEKILSYEKFNDESLDKSYVLNHLAADAYISKENDIFKYDGKIAIDGYLSKYPSLKKWYLFDHYNCACNRHEDKKGSSEEWRDDYSIIIKFCHHILHVYA